jgi:hypothetical protein
MGEDGSNFIIFTGWLDYASIGITDVVFLPLDKKKRYATKTFQTAEPGKQIGRNRLLSYAVIYISGNGYL